MKAEFSIRNNDLFWSVFDFNEKTLRGETIRWSGYNDDFWRREVREDGDRPVPTATA